MKDHSIQVKLFGLGGAGMNIVEAFGNSPMPVECRLLTHRGNGSQRHDVHLIGRPPHSLGGIFTGKKAIEGEQKCP